MQQLGNNRATLRKTVVCIAAVLLGAAVLCQPGLANAAHGGGGGGLHGGGGFHGGGFGGFHGGGFHGHAFHDGRFHGRFGGGGLGWPYYSYPWWGDYPDYGYDYNSQPYAQTWYYCSNPAGYYPYITQCNTGWQAVPAS